MPVLAKLTGFLVALTAVFGVAYLAGTQSETLLAPVATHETAFSGLSASTDGYTLRAVQRVLEPGDDQFVEFRITGPDGQPVPAYDEVDGSHLHLVALRRDLTGFQHVYPAEGEGASWWAVLNLTPGPWHVTVEFQPQALGRQVILATDFTVSGDYRPSPQAAPSDRVEVDGLTVTKTGSLTTRADSQTRLEVSADGRPVTDIQPAHGGLAHAIVFRPSDLGFLHLHADETTGTGPDLAFAGGPPEPGTYQLFVEFFRNDRLVVAPFTMEVTR
ncbi:MAG TPA: hypothetical protein VIT20_05640 [Propionibacteriaceae bacterium]